MIPGFDLKDLLAELGLADLPRQAVRQLTGSLEHEAGRKGGEVVARAILESIDQVMEADGPSLSTEQSVLVGTALAQAVATELRILASEVEAYAPLQAAVVQAKAGQGDLKAARTSRTAKAREIKAAFAAVVPEG